MLYKYCLTMVFKKKGRGKDGMPKKHDPKRERERERERKDGMPKKHGPMNKVRHKRSM